MKIKFSPQFQLLIMLFVLVFTGCTIQRSNLLETIISQIEDKNPTEMIEPVHTDSASPIKTMSSNALQIIEPTKTESIDENEETRNKKIPTYTASLFNPNFDLLIYSLDGNLYTFNPSKEESNQITSTGDIYDFELSKDASYAVPINNHVKSIKIINIENGQETKIQDLDNDLWLDKSKVELSPNGNQIAFSGDVIGSKCSTIIKGIHTNKEIKICSNNSEENGNYYHWSDNSKSLYFLHTYFDEKDVWTHDIVQYKIDEDESKVIYHFSQEEFTERQLPPAPLGGIRYPNNSEYFIIYNPPGQMNAYYNEGELYILSLKGDFEYYAKIEFADISWASNGISFVTDDKFNHLTIYNLPIIEGIDLHTRWLDVGSANRVYGWSPDGLRIVYLNEQGDYRLLTFNKDYQNRRFEERLISNTLLYEKTAEKSHTPSTILKDNTPWSPSGSWLLIKNKIINIHDTRTFELKGIDQYSWVNKK